MINGDDHLNQLVRSIERLDAERDELCRRRNAAAFVLLAGGFTSRHLAEVVGVTHQTVRNWAEAAR